jgi:hypothetical protein
VLKVLASQAAVSLENTRLYRDLENREAIAKMKKLGIYRSRHQRVMDQFNEGSELTI